MDIVQMPTLLMITAQSDRKIKKKKESKNMKIAHKFFTCHISVEKNIYIKI